MNQLKPIAQNTLLEITLTSQQKQAINVLDVRVWATLTAPSGKTHTRLAFWDGDNTWRIRFCPTEAGRWTWHTTASEPQDAGLHKQTGQVHCLPYGGKNTLYQRGSVQVAAKGSHFVHADGTPFFWLADIAWNGLVSSGWHDWLHYLHGRRLQGFTVIQFAATHWRGAETNFDGQPAYSQVNGLQIYPEFFQKIDRKIQTINESGMLAAPVLFWADQNHSGLPLNKTDAIKLGRYMLARWGGYHLFYLLVAETNLNPDEVAYWQDIGRSIFDQAPTSPVSLLPQAQTWPDESILTEPWYQFMAYQSGQSANEATINWLKNQPKTECPSINIGPVYEHYQSQTQARPTKAIAVRQAIYTSLFSAQPAGISYGHQGVWPWLQDRETLPAFPELASVPPWYVGLDSAGCRSITALMELLDNLPWWTLKPAPHLLQQDPDSANLALCTDDGQLALVYLPAGGHIKLNVTNLPARWVNPRTGDEENLPPFETDPPTLEAPNQQDWLLWLGQK